MGSERGTAGTEAFFHADRASVRAVPGAVFMRLHAASTDGPGRDVASAYVELTPGEALGFRAMLDECIGICLAAGHAGHALDAGVLPAGRGNLVALPG